MLQLANDNRNGLLLCVSQRVAVQRGAKTQTRGITSYISRWENVICPPSTHSLHLLTIFKYNSIPDLVFGGISGYDDDDGEDRQLTRCAHALGNNWSCRYTWSYHNHAPARAEIDLRSVKHGRSSVGRLVWKFWFCNRTALLITWRDGCACNRY